MIRVKLWGSLRRFAGDQEWVEVEASTFKEVVDQLALAYPALQPQLDRGVSLALNGKIYSSSWFTPVSPEDEVVLLPFMVGG